MPTDAPSELRRFPAYKDILALIRFDKPVGTLLLLWPTLTALWLVAGGFPGWKLLAVFVLGTFLMRSAGCCMNDIADRNFDRHVKRTAQRPVTSGRVSVKQAALIGGLLALLAFALVSTTNRLTMALSVVALLVACVYPYAKRVISVPQLVLGVAFSFGIPMSFAAVLGQVPWDSWALLAVNLYWVLAYDTIYAMVDRDDDLKIGIKTSAIAFGEKDVEVVMVCYVLFLLGMAAVGWHFNLHWPFYTGILLGSVLVLYYYFLIRGRDRDQCFKAFRHNHWLGLLLFAGMFVDRYGW